MSITSRSEHQWPAAADQNTESTSPSTYSSLSVRRQYEHAIPTGTVASRIRILQGIQGMADPTHPSPELPSRQPGSVRSTIGRRMSSRLPGPVLTSPKSVPEPQAEQSHSYFIPPRTRSNYRPNYVTSAGKVHSASRSKSGLSTVPASQSRKPQYKERVLSKNSKDREITAYKTALSDYSRQEISRITEVDSHDHSGDPQYSARIPIDEDITRVPSYVSENTDATTSTARRESVRDLYHAYGIERPDGLVSSTDHSQLELEPSNRHVPPPKTPIADSFMHKKASAESFGQPSRPPTPPPLPPPRGSSAKSDHVKYRKGSCKDQSRKSPVKNDYDDQLVVAERLRHERAKEEHGHSRMGSIPQDGSSGSKVTQPSTPVVDHSNHSPDNLTRMLLREARLQKKAATPEPLKYGKRIANEESNSPSSLPDRSTSVKPAPAFTSRVKDYSADLDTPKTQPFHTPQQFPAVGYFASEKQETLPRSSPVQSNNGTYEHVPTHSSPLAQHHAERAKSWVDEMSLVDMQKISAPEKSVIIPKPLVTPKRKKVRAQKHKETPINAILREPRKSQSEYVTSLEAQSPVRRDDSLGASPKEFSFLAADPDLIMGRTDMQSPIIAPTSSSPRKTDRKDQSNSSSVSIESPFSSCGTDTCRATHAGHAPYRHSISCTEKRRNDYDRGKTDSGYEAGLSHAEDVAPSHHHAELRQDQSSHGSNQIHQSEPIQGGSAERNSQCQYCSGNLDRCQHGRDDCKCNNCQGLLQYTRQYVLAEQERRSNQHHGSNTARTKDDMQRYDFLPKGLSKPQSSQTATNPVIDTPAAKAEEQRRPSSHRQIREKYPLKAHVPRTNQRTDSSQTSQPQSFSGEVGPVLSPAPQRDRFQQLSWTQSSGLDMNGSQKSNTRPGGLPKSKSWKVQKQQRESQGRPEPSSPGKNGRSPTPSPTRQRREVKGEKSTSEDKPPKPARSSTTVVLNPGSRLSVSAPERKPSIQNAPSISKILTQHQTTEIRAPSPPPWSPKAEDIRRRSKPKQPGVPTKHRSSSLITVVPPPNVASDDSTSISPKTPRKPHPDPFLTMSSRSISEELMKQTGSICPMRIPIRRSHNRLRDDDRSTDPPPTSKPHISVGHIDSILPPMLRLRTPCPRTPGTATPSTIVSRPISPPAQESDGQRQHKKVTRRLSTLFQLRDKKNTTPSPFTPAPLPTSEEGTVVTEPPPSEEKQLRKKKSRGLKIANTEDAQKRRWSLKLVTRREDKDVVVDVDHGVKPLKSTEHELDDCERGFSDAANEVSQDQKRDRRAGGPRSPMYDEREAEIENDYLSQDWSRSGKGQVSSSSASASSPRKAGAGSGKRDTHGRKNVERTTPSSNGGRAAGSQTTQKKSTKESPAADTTVTLPVTTIPATMQNRPVLRNRDPTGLVSSKVEKWNQELASLGIGLGPGPGPSLPRSPPPSPATFAQPPSSTQHVPLRSSSIASSSFSSAKVALMQMKSPEDRRETSDDGLPVRDVPATREKGEKPPRTEDTDVEYARQESDEHECVWKSLYLASSSTVPATAPSAVLTPTDPELDVRGDRDLASAGVRDEQRAGGRERKGNVGGTAGGGRQKRVKDESGRILGVTVRVHVQGRDDVVIDGRVVS